MKMIRFTKTGARVLLILLAAVLAVVLTLRAGETQDVPAAATPAPTPVPVTTAPAPTPVPTPVPAPTAEPVPAADPTQAPAPTEEPVTEEEDPAAPYTEDEVQIIVNVVCGEVGLTGIDSLMQEEARVVLNTAAYNGMSVYEAVACRLPSGYYLWHPQYTTPEFTENFRAQHPEAYARVCENVTLALTGKMAEAVPENVIYADVAAHGSGVWKQYSVDTGWYQSTVYLCYA